MEYFEEFSRIAQKDFDRSYARDYKVEIEPLPSVIPNESEAGVSPYKAVATRNKNNPIYGDPIGEAEINGYFRLIFRNRDGEMSYMQSNGRRYLINPIKIKVIYFDDDQLSLIMPDPQPERVYITLEKYDEPYAAYLTKREFLIWTIIGGWIGVNFFLNNNYKKGLLYLVLFFFGISLLLTIYDIFNISKMSETKYAEKWGKFTDVYVLGENCLFIYEDRQNRFRWAIYSRKGKYLNQGSDSYNNKYICFDESTPIFLQT